MPLYLNKDYRSRVSPGGLDNYEVKVKESDLHVSSKGNFSPQAAEILQKVRGEIEDYLAGDSDFLNTFSPVPVKDSMPAAVKKMAMASVQTGVGPMAAVAGVIAGEVGRGLLKYSPEVIVENGGDVYINTARRLSVAVFAGDSPLSMKVGIKTPPGGGEISVCSSSGTVGHSVSGGNADAALCVSPSPALADAAATALGNSITGSGDMEEGLEFALGIEGIKGCLVIYADKMAAKGNIQLCRID